MTIALLLAVAVSLAGCSKALPADLLSGSVTVTLEATGPAPTALAVDGHPVPASALPITLAVEPGRHELILGRGRSAARLPLVLGLGRPRVFVGGASRAAVIWPAGSHVLPADSALTAQTGPDTFASFRGWLGSSTAAVVLPGEETYVWDLAEGTLDRLWVSPAAWVSGDGRFIAGVNDHGLVLKELSSGAESVLTSWPGAGQPGRLGEFSVVNASPEGDWFAFSVRGAHEAPVWPEVWLYRAPSGLTRICRPEDFEALVPGYKPVDLIAPSSSSTLFVAVAPNGGLRLVELSLPRGTLRASDPLTDAPNVLRPCGLWGGRLLLIGLLDGPPASGAFLTYDFASARLEAADLPVNGVPVFGAVHPTTGALWLGLKEEGNRVSLAELPAGGNDLAAWRISFPVSTFGLALVWSPDGRRAILKTSWGETGLVVYDPGS